VTAPVPGGSLGERLRSGTRALHVEVERGPFMQRLLKGQLDRPAYCRLLRNLHPLYATLEAGLERHQAHPQVAPIFLPELWRSARLEADLEVLHGPGWREALAVVPAAADYRARLEALAADAPELLAAHVYVRSLGDLNGGQMLERVVAGSVATGVAGGTSFYDFGSPQAVQRLAAALRAGLASLGLDAAGEAALVEEARAGFERHRALFAQLG
jgi:heme oxygenase